MGRLYEHEFDVNFMHVCFAFDVSSVHRCGKSLVIIQADEWISLVIVLD